MLAVLQLPFYNYFYTFVEEAIDAAESRIVSVRCIRVELENEAALRRVVVGLRECGTVSAQREARDSLLGDLGSLQVHVQLHVVHASVYTTRTCRYET